MRSEHDALTIWLEVRRKTPGRGCDPCVNLTTLAGLAEAGADLSDAYGASPSGAFLDADR
jgi:hypothetical protein